MRFRIHWEYQGTEDHVDVEGETVAEVQQKAQSELEKRGMQDQYAWSEQLS